MTAIKLPEPFAALDGLAADPTVDQARQLTAASKAVPELQRWLRQQRQLTARGLLDSKKTAAELAPAFDCKPQRVYDIASGHSTSKSTAAIALPRPFTALDGLAADPTEDRARTLTAAVKAVPELQRWLREQRQFTVRGLLDADKTPAELAPVLEVTPQRVSDIASGHVRYKSAKASYQTDAGEQT